MTRALLTIDLGNTSGSAARVEIDDAGAVNAAESLYRWRRTEDEAAACDRAVGLALERGIEEVVLSAVGSKEREASVLSRLELAGLPVRAQPGSGLVMDIEHPETCGMDRQFAMRAALSSIAVSRTEAAPATRALVVDAGTALTVDAGELRGERPVFRGGAIAPGPGLAASALEGAGARLPRFSIDPDVPALGRSTVDALRSGVAIGFRGAVRELAHAVATEAFGTLEGVHLFLTGGARAYALPALAGLFGDRVVEDALLVHRGLALASGDAALDGGRPGCGAADREPR